MFGEKKEDKHLSYYFWLVCFFKVIIKFKSCSGDSSLVYIVRERKEKLERSKNKLAKPSKSFQIMDHTAPH